MATNSLLTISMITAESARVLGNNLCLAKTVNRDYDDEFGVKGAKIGQSINVRKPARYATRTGAVVDIQAQNETYAPLTFVDPIGVDLSFTSSELTFSLDDFSSRVIKPAVTAMANKIDSDGFALMDKIANTIGTAGGTALTGTTGRTAILNAASKLYQNGAPTTGGQLSAIMESGFNAVLSDGNASLFNPAASISKNYISGFQGDFGGFKCYMDQAVPSRTFGTFTGATTVGVTAVNNATQLTLAFGTSGTLKAGDTFTVTGVNAVNPQTKVAYKDLQNFVVQSVASGNGTASVVVNVFPQIVLSGPTQTVSATPTSGAVVTYLGNTGAVGQQAVAFHRDAFMLANKQLILPMGVENASYVSDEQSKVGIRLVTAYDIRTNQHISRFDCMIAWATLYEQLACKIYTA